MSAGKRSSSMRAMRRPLLPAMSREPSLSLSARQGRRCRGSEKMPRREQPLVVYCSGYDCHDSRDLATRLLAAGYRTVYVFEGGYPEWRDAGYPTREGKQ